MGRITPAVTCTGTRADTSSVEAVMLKIFREVGVPELVRTDGALSFMSRQFKEFLEEWGIDHQTSSHYPRSNGLAESAVKSAKKLLKRCWDNNRGRINEREWSKGLIQQRNTPGISGKSPAEIVYGRPLRDDLPTHPSHFKPRSRPTVADEERAGTPTRRSTTHDDRRESRRHAAKRWYDQHARDLPEFPVGTRVRVQDVRTKRWDRCGVVTHVGPFRRYSVRFDDGGEVDRNRCHLRKRYPLYPVPLSNSDLCSGRPPPPPARLASAQEPRATHATGNGTTSPLQPSSKACAEAYRRNVNMTYKRSSVRVYVGLKGGDVVVFDRDLRGRCSGVQ